MLKIATGLVSRWVRFAWVVTPALIAVLVFAQLGAAKKGPEFAEVLETRKLVLREQGGSPRGLLEVADNGQPKLSLYDKRSAKVMEVSVDDKNGPVVVLYDGGGVPRLALRTTVGPEIDFCDSRGIPMLSAAYYDGDYASESFSETAGRRQRFSLLRWQETSRTWTSSARTARSEYR